MALRLPRAIRDAELAWFRARAEHHIARGFASALFAVSPDRGTLRRHVIVSHREVPLWPHVCGADPREHCESSTVAGDEVDGFRGIPIFDLALPLATHTPFAVARGREVAQLDRPHGWAREDLVGADVPRPVDWLADPRARGLYDEVCTNPASDEPRHVLADYLLEHDYGHGVVIAFGLARTLDEDAYQRHESLLRENGPRWLGPLLQVIPAAGAHFRRGFLWRAEICAPLPVTRDGIRGTPALGTVEQLRVIQPSPGFAIDPSLVALREVAVLDATNAAILADSPRPWAIERLGIYVDAPSLARLVDATTLPALRHLELGGELATVANVRSAPWWTSLETLTLVVDRREPWLVRAAWLARTGPRVAVTSARRGWQLEFAPDGSVRVSMRDFDSRATIAELRRLIAALPGNPPVELVASPFFAPRPGDL